MDGCIVYEIKISCNQPIFFTKCGKRVITSQTIDEISGKNVRERQQNIETTE